MNLFRIFLTSFGNPETIFYDVAGYLSTKYPDKLELHGGILYRKAPTRLALASYSSFDNSIRVDAKKWLKAGATPKTIESLFALAQKYSQPEDWTVAGSLNKQNIIPLCTINSPIFAYFAYQFNKAQVDNARKIKSKDLTEAGFAGWVWEERYETAEDRYTKFLWKYSIGTDMEDTRWTLVSKGKIAAPEPQERESNVAPLEILQYSAKVEQYLPVQASKQIRYGIELELENATEANLSIIHKHLKKHAIMKRDGSLSNGVEIVSVPASIEEHKKQYKPFFDDRHTLEAKTNCGIHIHVSRENMSFLALGRMIKFFNKNKSLVEKIAGRSNSNYARVRDDWELTTPWYSVSGDKYAKTKRFNWDKYTGINVAPQHTAEFRIFKSTTKWEEFCRFLEFTESFVNYCTLAGNDNSGKIRKIDDMFVFDNYKHFVNERASVYPFLAKFLRTELA